MDEARLLATFVDDPALVTAEQMDTWCRDFAALRELSGASVAHRLSKQTVMQATKKTNTRRPTKGTGG